MDSHNVTFLLNKPFHDGISQNLCEMPGPTYLECSVSWKKWKLRTRMFFSPEGMISEHTNLNANVASNKTYLRLGEEDEQNALTPPSTEDPFVTDGNYILWE